MYSWHETNWKIALRFLALARPQTPTAAAKDQQDAEATGMRLKRGPRPNDFEESNARTLQVGDSYSEMDKNIIV